MPIDRTPPMHLNGTPVSDLPKIIGYRDLTQQDRVNMNHVKEFESHASQMLKVIRDYVEARFGSPLMQTVKSPDAPLEHRRLDESRRQIALARTALETGFYHLNRAVAAPDSPWI